MNERIKELVKQAGGHISIRNLASNPVQHIESVELWDDRIEKFAELIVRECVAICEDTDGEHIADARWGRRCCALEIKEHFGVEE
jgi:hypothetical protein